LDTSGGSEIGSRDSVATLIERAQNSFDGLVLEFPDARLNPDVLYQNASLLLFSDKPEACLEELRTLAKAEPSGRYGLRSMLLEARASVALKKYDRAKELLEAVLKTTQEEETVKEATTVKTIVDDAIKSKTQFADAGKQYWPNNLFADGSFEKAEIKAGQPLPFQIEWYTSAAPAQANSIRVHLVDGIGVEGKRCLMLECTQPLTVPLYIVLRFPTAIGDRVFGRFRVMSMDANFMFSEI
jgi:hypothetical protein